MPIPELSDPKIVGNYTEQTRVILSFGAAKGGFEFAMQLRWDIMKRLYNMRWDGDPAVVYLDAESLKDEGHTTYNWDEKLGIFKMQNKFWASFYQGALNSSKVMIFLFTHQWLSSQYCWEELEWYRNRIATGHDVKPIFVVFPDAQQLLGTGMITTRDGRRHNPAHIWESMLAVPGAAKVNVNTIADPGIRTVFSDSGHQYAFRYACSEVELTQILYHVSQA